MSAEIVSGWNRIRSDSSADIYLTILKRNTHSLLRRGARDDIGRRQNTNQICSKDKTRIGFFDTRKKNRKEGKFGRVLQEKAACIDRSIDVKKGKGKWRRVMEGKGDQ